MARIQLNTEMSNRYGLNLTVRDSREMKKVYQAIEFGNVSNITLNGDTHYATGGQNKRRQVAFYDKLTGELTISTHILTQNLLSFMAGEGATWDGESPLVFKQRFLSGQKWFTIVGETVGQDRFGVAYSQRLIFHRVRPKVAYNRDYSGAGDVVDVDIVFELSADDNGAVVTCMDGWMRSVVIDTTLFTPWGYVDEDGCWHIDQFADVDEHTLKIQR